MFRRLFKIHRGSRKRKLTRAKAAGNPFIWNNCRVLRQQFRRFACNIVTALIKRACSNVETTRARYDRAKRKGSKKYQDLREKLLEIHKRRKKTGSGDGFRAPAADVDYSNFILTTSCVNGRSGMRQIDLSDRPDSLHQCWWWGGDFKAKVLSASQQSLSLTSGNKVGVKIYCRFGTACQRWNSCPHPHVQKSDSKPNCQEFSASTEDSLPAFQGAESRGEDSLAKSDSAHNHLTSPHIPLNSRNLEVKRGEITREKKRAKTGKDIELSMFSMWDVKTSLVSKCSYKKLYKNSSSSKTQKTRLRHSMEKCLRHYVNMIKSCGGDVSLFKTLSTEVKSSQNRTSR